MKVISQSFQWFLLFCWSSCYSSWRLQFLDSIILVQDFFPYWQALSWWRSTVSSLSHFWINYIVLIQSYHSVTQTASKQGTKFTLQKSDNFLWSNIKHWEWNHIIVTASELFSDNYVFNDVIFQWWELDLKYFHS